MPLKLIFHYILQNQASMAIFIVFVHPRRTYLQSINAVVCSKGEKCVASA